MAKSKTKIYFWLRLDNNFFKNLAIKQLRRMSGGDTYVLIYQKMMLQSLENQGFIYFEGVLDSLAEEIAMALDENVEDVQVTIAYFQSKGLLQIGEENEIFLEQVPMLLDQETNWNRYKRQQNKKLEKFQPLSNHLPTDIDIEIDIKNSKSKNKNQNKNAAADFSEIYSYYQQEIGILSPNQAEQLADYLKLDNFEPELLKRAIDKASNNAKRSFGYVNSILRNWKQNGITTLTQADEEDKKFQESKHLPQVDEDLHSVVDPAFGF
ncbi:DnaD domain protein [uncultured Streptococcus sp.]|uniref:DnaD domain protein n=1 Tax=uncultured Streptococcus sp. TaxID=83427 RepID=UPI00258C66BD|nr:DnaD domain protein [uncultured Streptococcus sp.]